MFPKRLTVQVSQIVLLCPDISPIDQRIRPGKVCGGSRVKFAICEKKEEIGFNLRVRFCVRCSFDRFQFSFPSHTTHVAEHFDLLIVDEFLYG